MKKMMFNDKFGLTKAVLEGRKTQTRRLTTPFLSDTVRIGYSRFEIAYGRELRCWNDTNNSYNKFKIPYKVGEVVAVSQSYKDAISSIDWVSMKLYEGTSGWNNKMFVAANLMPHQIRITDVRVERLQDISGWDYLKEGVHEATREFPWYWIDGSNATFNDIREAFAHLINKVSRKDVWSENPYVFVYDFELVK